MPTEPIKPREGSHHKKPQDIKETKAHATGQAHQGLSGPEFIPIHRDWTAFKYDDSPAVGIGQAQHSTVDAAHDAAMQRWNAEAMRNQPFHIIEAVALPETRSAGQNDFETQRSGTSVGYIAD